MNEKTKDKITLNKAEKIFLCVSCFVLLVCLIVSVVILTWNSSSTTPNQATFSDIERICELATLKCYFHNATEYRVDPEGLLQYGYGKVGYKKLWLEYSGIVKIGVDASNIWVGTPNESGIVSVYIPEAKIIEIDSDESTMTEPIYETGAFTTISPDDKATAYNNAQKNMREDVEADTALLAKAHNNAKKLIENYIVEIGKSLGVNYSVQWLDSQPTFTDDGGN